MGSIRIGVGTEWLLEGRVYRVVRQPSADTFIAVDLKFNVEREFSRQQILDHYGQGELRFATPTTTWLFPPEPASPRQDVRDLTDQEQQILRQRWQFIEPLTQLKNHPSRWDFQQRACQLVEQGHRVSASSLRRYFDAWRTSGGDRRALIPSTRRSGGRGRSRRSSILQKYPLLRRLVEDAIRDVYLTTARRPISAVTRRVLEDIQRLNARLPSDQAQPIPRERALSRAISRCISQMDPWEVDRQRWGKRIADQRHRPTSAQRLATRILERVEIDHSPLKVVVGTSAGPIGQPWLTVLIDYYSRMIVGFCLGFEPPSYAVLMEGLRHAILPKTHIAEKHPMVKGTWPCYGLPETVVCDRGPDLTSKDLENAAFQLGIELDFNPPRMPHLKGTVEAFFGGLNDQLMSTLPGRTFRSWERRADYDPDVGPLLPYEALVDIIHVHLIDVYAQSKHPTIPKTRLEAWKHSAAEHPPFLPAEPDELIVLLSKRTERTLSTRGIELGGMFYTSHVLMALRPELAANNVDSNRLTVRYNPWNLGTVWVLHPITGKYIKASAADSTLEGMTEYQWRVLKRAIRERFDKPDHLMSLAEGRNTIRDIVEKTMQKPSQKRRVRAARFLQPMLDPPTHVPRSVETADDPVDTADSEQSTSTADTIDTDQQDDPDRASQSTVGDPNLLEVDDIDVDDWPIDSCSA